RSQYLRNLQQSGAASRPSDMYYSNNRAAPVQTNPYGTTAYSPPAPAAHQVRLAPPPGTASTTASPAAAQWVGPGRLYRSCFNIDGRPTYGFEMAGGQTRLYVGSCPGLELESQIGHGLYLYGSTSYRAELRSYLLTASQASAAQ